jgi:ribonuclease HI
LPGVNKEKPRKESARNPAPGDQAPRKKKATQSKLFAEPHSEEARPSPAQLNYVTAYIDGGARGNPGPAGYGVVLKDSEGENVAELSRYLGHRTNNYAEYCALLAALEHAIEKGMPALRVVSDSELMVKQMQGEYKVRSPELRELYERARALVRRLASFRIEHVRREKNRDADRLANLAMDEGMKR